MSTAQSRVFSAYRRLFRARQFLFRGDTLALRESRLAIKAEFVKNRAAPTSGAHFEAMLAAADEASDMLLHGIVQGKLDEQSGNYSMSSTLVVVLLFAYVSLTHYLLCSTEVKFEPEHVEGMADMHLPKVEPVTDSMVEQLQRQQVPPVVEVHQSHKE